MSSNEKPVVVVDHEHIDTPMGYGAEQSATAVEEPQTFTQAETLKSGKKLWNEALKKAQKAQRLLAKAMLQLEEEAAATATATATGTTKAQKKKKPTKKDKVKRKKQKKQAKRARRGRSRSRSRSGARSRGSSTSSSSSSSSSSSLSSSSSSSSSSDSDGGSHYPRRSWFGLHWGGRGGYSHPYAYPQCFLDSADRSQHACGHRQDSHGHHPFGRHGRGHHKHEHHSPGRHFPRPHFPGHPFPGPHFRGHHEHPFPPHGRHHHRDRDHRGPLPYGHFPDFDWNCDFPGFDRNRTYGEFPQFFRGVGLPWGLETTEQQCRHSSRRPDCAVKHQTHPSNNGKHHRHRHRDVHKSDKHECRRVNRSNSLPDYYRHDGGFIFGPYSFAIPPGPPPPPTPPPHAAGFAAQCEPKCAGMHNRSRSRSRLRSRKEHRQVSRSRSRSHSRSNRKHYPGDRGSRKHHQYLEDRRPHFGFDTHGRHEYWPWILGSYGPGRYFGSHLSFDVNSDTFGPPNWGAYHGYPQFHGRLHYGPKPSFGLFNTPRGFF